MKITPKQQAKIGKKVRALKNAGYTTKEIVQALKGLSATEFIEMEIKKKES